MQQNHIPVAKHMILSVINCR